MNILTVNIQLRDIEILAQLIEALEAEGKDDETLRDIQKILYSTEVLPLPSFSGHSQIGLIQIRHKMTPPPKRVTIDPEPALGHMKIP